MIAFDAAEIRLLGQGMAASWLPGLQRVRERGASVQLCSIANLLAGSVSPSLYSGLLQPESDIFALQLRIEKMRHERIDGVRPSAVWSQWLLLSERWARLGRLLGIAAWIVGFGRGLAEPAPVAILPRS